MLPLEIALEAGQHVRTGIYGDPSRRQAPLPTPEELLAVDEAESAPVLSSALADVRDLHSRSGYSSTSCS